jgi:L-lactate dehydrogenase complex protein LldG
MESAREEILRKIHDGLKSVKDEPVPHVRLKPHAGSPELFMKRVNALGGKTYRAVRAADARDYVTGVLDGRTAIASNAPLLREWGISTMDGVTSGYRDREKLREICSHAGVGITCADYALADTGTLVMLSSMEEARMISLLPPAHIAVVPKARILGSLDELLTRVPLPADLTSSMVLITGPSRTGDIEQILVRGVHGPGEIHVVVI